MSMQRAGRVRIKLGSQTLDTMPGATVNIGGNNRATTVGANKVLGYSEAPMQSRVECTVSLAAGQSIKDFDLNDVTVTAEVDTGQVYSGRNMWLTEPPSFTQGEGGPVRLVFEGQPMEEIS
jgi:hypothetical protein